MSKEKENKKTYSFTKRLSYIFYVLFAVTLSGMILYSAYFSHSLTQRTFKDVQQFLSLYNKETSQNLKNVDYYLMEITSYSPEISSVSLQKNVEGNYTSLVHISQLFEFNLNSLTSIKGMFAYFPKSQTWVGHSGTIAATNTFQPFLKEQFKSGAINEYIDQSNGLKWIPCEFDNKVYMVKAFVYDNSVVGAWTDLDTLSSSLSSLDDLDAIIIFSDENGNFVNAKSPSEENREIINELSKDRNALKIPLNKTLNSSTMITFNGSKYMLTTSELDYCDYYISAMIPQKSIGQTTKTFWRYSLFFLLAVLVISVVIIFLFNRLVSSTVRMIRKMNDAIIGGDIENRIDLSDERCEEVIQTAEGYNRMVDSIQQLKMDIYEERIQKKNFQLYFLKSQVAPHFLINCLNMISYLADGTEENTRILRQMIDGLSKHLRYTLRTEDKVSLEQEIEFLDNYVELTKLRFPGCITYEKHFDESAMQASVFPVILIGFMENTFKYNLVMGEPLTVIDKSETYEKDGEKRLHIIHIDSGVGFSEDFLEKYSASEMLTIQSPNGEKIGLRNVINRLKLYYGETAQLHLSNEPGMGARVDIDIPYVLYSASGETQNTASIIS